MSDALEKRPCRDSFGGMKSRHVVQPERGCAGMEMPRPLEGHQPRIWEYFAFSPIKNQPPQCLRNLRLNVSWAPGTET